MSSSERRVGGKARNYSWSMKRLTVKCLKSGSKLVNLTEKVCASHNIILTGSIDLQWRLQEPGRAS
jgi:hypothetical protein